MVKYESGINHPQKTANKFPKYWTLTECGVIPGAEWTLQTGWAFCQLSASLGDTITAYIKEKLEKVHLIHLSQRRCSQTVWGVQNSFKKLKKYISLFTPEEKMFPGQSEDSNWQALLLLPFRPSLLSPCSPLSFKETDPGCLPQARAEPALGYTSESI